MQPGGFSDIKRDYGPADVARLAGFFRIRHTLAELGAARLRHLLGYSSTTALAGSTGAAEFHEERAAEPPQYGDCEGLVHNHDCAVHDWAAQ